ncbi:MAG: DUF362 domain-containing protein [Armatimonadota bacterium]
MSRVVVRSLRDGKVTGPDLDQAVEQMLDQIYGGPISFYRDRVLVKPNLHQVQDWTTGGTTSPHLVAALVRSLRRRQAADIIVADGPFHAIEKPSSVFTETGMAAAVEEAGARWVCFHEEAYKPYAGASKWLPPVVGLPSLLAACDRVINVACMKTHFNCLASLGIKNLKGCLRPQDKRALHHLDLDRALVAVAGVVRPAVTIIDGTVGMEGMGPAEGTPADMRVLLGGRDLVAVDAVASHLMGLEPQQVRATRLAHEAGLGQMELDRITIVGDDPEPLRRRFKLPYQDLFEHHPRLQLYADGACSGCLSRLFEALSSVAEASTELPARTVVVGRSEGDDHAVFLGDCTRLRSGDTFVPGCPPGVEAIRQALL